MRRLGTGLAAAAAVAGAGLALLGGVGVAGWRGGWILAIAVFPAAVGAAAWFGMRPGGGAVQPLGRGLYTTAVAILALVAGVQSIDYAPESSGRLAQRLDELPLPFYVQLSQRTSGHGWCDPSCPSVTRTYRGPQVNPRTAKVQVGAALAGIDLLPDYRLLLGDRQNRTIDDSTEGVDVHVDLTTDKDGRPLATITLTSKRGFDQTVPSVG